MGKEVKYPLQASAEITFKKQDKNKRCQLSSASFKINRKHGVHTLFYKLLQKTHAKSNEHFYHIRIFIKHWMCKLHLFWRFKSEHQNQLLRKLFKILYILTSLIYSVEMIAGHLKEIYHEYGSPKLLQHGQSRPFRGKVQKVVTFLKVIAIKNSPYHLQSQLKLGKISCLILSVFSKRCYLGQNYEPGS